MSDAIPFDSLAADPDPDPDLGPDPDPDRAIRRIPIPIAPQAPTISIPIPIAPSGASRLRRPPYILFLTC